ncbi:hypothetical protein [Novosphingobium album (ex Liu et al. 2023)]|uniref:Uncharacterized protein n=1 Tax=Novosphingobium album (ex Liu et al. 2023) TaxID=3031130 RepID=A0ABT5WRH0_9SPHN|nr:hypothetical protein [Novosphingobium album (ex Liu et al. 2023)]MDE8652621.1 hypothetical protein [Novosphingobium album (ex Liu et al. 2023)]
MSVAGTYECITKTPLGDQNGLFTVVPGEGDSFTGSIAGDLGTMAVENGTIAGNALSWKMKMTVPMPIDLECTATVDGDRLTGEVKAGMFGTMQLTGIRKG